MKRIAVICCLFTVLFVQNIYSQTLGDLYTERTAGFTMSMPRDWQVTDINQKYYAILGQTENGFTPNITFADDTYSGSLSEYIDEMISMLGLFYADLTVIGRGSFSTSAGLRGDYAVIQGRLGEVGIRQKIYLFPNVSGDSIIAITGTAPLVNGERFDAVFDESVRTFKWTR